jgi:hypothetical protein
MTNQILQRRATLFVDSPIELSQDFITECTTQLKDLDFIPISGKSFGLKIENGKPSLFEGISLELKHKNNVANISFGSNRIDIISTTTISDINTDNYLSLVEKSSQIIMSILKLALVRVAIGCVCAKEIDKVSELYNRLVPHSKCISPVEWNIRSVVRKPISLSNCSLDMNYVVNVAFAENINKKDCENSVKLEFDFNTVVGTPSEVLKNIVEKFWTYTFKDMITYIEDYEAHIE